MNLTQKRFAMFLGACVPMRLLLVALAYYLPRRNLTLFKLLAYLLLIPTIGFSVIYFFKLRDTSALIDNNVAWWDYLRPIHSLLYGISFLMAISNKPTYYMSVWKVLLLDVVIGFIAFLNYHIKEKSFNKLF